MPSQQTLILDAQYTAIAYKNISKYSLHACDHTFRTPLLRNENDCHTYLRRVKPCILNAETILRFTSLAIFACILTTCAVQKHHRS